MNFAAFGRSETMFIEVGTNGVVNKQLISLIADLVVWVAANGVAVDA